MDFRSPWLTYPRRALWSCRLQRICNQEDIANIEFGLKHRVEYFAQSYVGRAEDVARLRAEVEKHGRAKIIAKIERAEALKDLHAIIRVADAVMVARGDLGNEIPLETIPFVEADIIKVARAQKRPVIVATEMLSSMIDQDRPSRTDVTDIVYAVMHGADAVMLSNETAIGQFPVESVDMMERTLLEAEKHIAVPRRAL
jgi:pyruvate kinase